jgi:hypothetical protein
MGKPTFEGKVEVLSHLFLHYADEDNLKDFMEYNDFVMPFAYGLKQKMIEAKPSGKKQIGEAFAGLLEALEIEDTSFESWDDIQGILSI